MYIMRKIIAFEKYFLFTLGSLFSIGHSVTIYMVKDSNVGSARYIISCQFPQRKEFQIRNKRKKVYFELEVCYLITGLLKLINKSTTIKVPKA